MLPLCASDVDALQASLTDNFARMDKSAKVLDKTLAGLGAKEERPMLASAIEGIASMKTLLFASDGIVSKVRNQLQMKAKAQAAMDSLRSIVLKEAESEEDHGDSEGRSGAVDCRREQDHPL